MHNRIEYALGTLAPSSIPFRIYVNNERSAHISGDYDYRRPGVWVCECVRLFVDCVEFHSCARRAFYMGWDSAQAQEVRVWE